MPDSQPTPPWGLAYDERDLDALLSGETAALPAALRPIESTLAALRADATGRELSREAAARAAFRAFAPVPPAVVPTAWTAGPGPAAVTAHTLVLPPPGGRPEPVRRRKHRHRRTSAAGFRRPGIAVTGVAAAALIVVGAAVTGALTGSIGELTSFGRHPASASAAARASVQPSHSQGVLATGAAREPISSPKPSPSASAPAAPQPTMSPASLCREYFQYLAGFEHPMAGGAPTWVAVRGQLGMLAGGPTKINGYCFRVVASSFEGNGEWPPADGNAGGPGASGQSAAGTGGAGPAGGGVTGGGPAGGETGGLGSGTAGKSSKTAGKSSKTVGQSIGSSGQGSRTAAPDLGSASAG